VRRPAGEELGISARFHPAFGERPLLIAESRTRPPGEHVDVTLWSVLSGSTDQAVGAGVAAAVSRRPEPKS
jgi:8-oxo-dGTP diphosphatase